MQSETYNTRSQQTIFDTALSLYGNMEGVIDLLLLNDLDFESDLPASITYDVQDNFIVRYLQDKEVTTASGLVEVTPSDQVYINTGNGDHSVPELAPINIRTYTAKVEQNIFDVMTMVSGNMEDVIDLMIANDISFDSSLLGKTLVYSGEMFLDDDVATGGTYPIENKIRAFSAGFSAAFA